MNQQIADAKKNKEIPYFYGPRFPFKRLSFLQPVKVKNFVESHPLNIGFYGPAYRVLDIYKNDNPDHIFYVVGQAHKSQGKIYKSSGSGEDFEPGYLDEFNRHFIVKLQGGMNHTKMALLEDVIEMNKGEDAG